MLTQECELKRWLAQLLSTKWYILKISGCKRIQDSKDTPVIIKSETEPRLKENKIHNLIDFAQPCPQPFFCLLSEQTKITFAVLNFLFKSVKHNEKKKKKTKLNAQNLFLLLTCY